MTFACSPALSGARRRGELSSSSTDRLSTLITSPALDFSPQSPNSHQLRLLAPPAMKVRSISCPACDLTR